MTRDPRLEALEQQRRHPVHGVEEKPKQPTILFVTACTQDRRAWLAADDIHTLLRQLWSGDNAWLVGHYLLMPNHVHFFASRAWLAYSLEQWMTYWKRQFRRNHPHPAHRWLTDHWDLRIRSAAQYTEKWEYVRNNPVRKGLVAEPEQWPYQGVMHDLPWYEL